MEEKKPFRLSEPTPGRSERIKNTVELLRKFAQEELPSDLAEEVLDILSDPDDGGEEDN